MQDLLAPLAVTVATLATAAGCVLLQYECLTWIWRRVAGQRGPRRIRVLYSILAVLVLHLTQVLLFGLTIWALLQWPAAGGLAGALTTGFFDCLYLSAASFSTVGFGDVAPVGPIRFVAGAEGLSGLVLITWSASFTYLEMEKFWRPAPLRERK